MVPYLLEAPLFIIHWNGLFRCEILNIVKRVKHNKLNLKNYRKGHFNMLIILVHFETKVEGGVGNQQNVLLKSVDWMLK